LGACGKSGGTVWFGGCVVVVVVVGCMGCMSGIGNCGWWYWIRHDEISATAMVLLLLVMVVCSVDNDGTLDVYL
jgi:hypothetical protein